MSNTQTKLLSNQSAVDIGWGKELTSCVLDFVYRLLDIEMDRVEFCILNAINDNDNDNFYSTIIIFQYSAIK